MQTISSINIKYPPESAGRLMIVNVPIAHPNNSISEIQKMLFIKVKEPRTKITRTKQRPKLKRSFGNSVIVWFLVLLIFNLLL